MTVSELYKQVAGLGFESSLEDDSRFYFAAERALLQVARIRPATRTYTINHKPLKNAALIGSMDSSVKSDGLIIEAPGAKAYYFEADGFGTAYVEFFENGAWSIANVIILNGSRSFRAYKGFVKNGNNFVSGGVRIRFEGEYLCYVRRAALYESVYSPNEADITALEPFTRYDISELASDFLALASPPVLDGEHREILNQTYDIEDGRVVLIPYGLPGEYIIRYIKKPESISTESYAVDNDQRIDLADDLVLLMPNLVAAYILAEDEPQLAEYYLSLYNQQAAQIEANARSYAPVYISNNGW